MAEDVHGHIEQLVAEEHRLWELEASGKAQEHERQQLAELRIQLDRYWDLLRRRRAAASAGADPESVSLNDESTVENYLQ
ncbi:MAG TPA: DUF2630 family protein [Gaiellales bacterium]|jgi:hypothetical protein